MDKADIDVIITGYYRLQGNVAEITLYKIDKFFGDEKISFTFPLQSDADITDASMVTRPYDSIESKEYIPCRIVFRNCTILLNERTRKK